MRPTLRRSSLYAVAAMALLAAPAQAGALDPASPHSPNASDMNTAYWVMLVLAVLLALAIHAALIGAVVRHRHRRGRRATRVTAGRGIVGRAAGAFAVLATAVFVFGIVMARQARTVEPTGPNGLGASVERFAQVGLQDVPPAASETPPPSETEAVPGEEPTPPPGEGTPLVFDVIGQQWVWRFEYPGAQAPGQQVFTYGELVVPVDTTVILNVTSTDVIHGWWIPELGGQVEAVPGAISQTWFKADEEGVYEGPATRFDGTSHPAMRAWVRVVSPTEYEAYVKRLETQLRNAQEKVQEAVAESGATAVSGTAAGAVAEGGAQGAPPEGGAGGGGETP